MPPSLELTPETTRHSPVTSRRPLAVGADPALATLWQAVLNRLEDDPSISRANFATWLRGTQLLERDGDALVVGAQHTFALEKLERGFRSAIEQAVRLETGLPAAHVHFAVARQPSARPAEPAGARPLPLRRKGERPTDFERHDVPLKANCRPERSEGSEAQAIQRPTIQRLPASATALNPSLTFETFAVGRQNQFAYAAACAVADNPAFAYNPLVLYGPSGAGKTHLLHAIGGRVVGLRAGTRVTYLPMRALVAEWLRCGADVSAFAPYQERYRQSGVLLLDDLQLLPALGAIGAGLQFELARLIAGLLEADAQVVVASHVPPRSLGGLEEPLRARLQSGLIAEVGELAPGARTPPANVRALPVPSPPPAPAPARAPAPLPAAIPRRRTRPDDVIEAVSMYFGLDPAALLGKSREKRIVGPRQLAMYLMREEVGASLSEIGARLGGRDHTTVLHGYEKVAAHLENDPALRSDLAAIKARLVPAAANPVGAAAAAAAP